MVSQNNYTLYFTKQAQKNAEKIKLSPYKNKVLKLLELIKMNPYATNPPHEQLIGNLSGAYSRRINIQHRLVYQVIEQERIVKIIRMWTHYE